MITISIKETNSIFNSIEIKGHANSAEKGYDLVCAAVSAIVTGAFNSISEINNFQIELKEGYALLKAKGEVSSHDTVVIETLIKSLKTVQESNTKYVQVKN